MEVNRKCHLPTCKKPAGPATDWAAIDDFKMQTRAKFFCTRKHAEKYFDADKGKYQEAVYLCKLVKRRKVSER